MLEKAEQGIWPSFAPLGYLNVTGLDSKRTIAPDPETASIIVRLFERYATGNYSGRDLGEMARSEGLVFRKSRTPVSPATVYKILRNRIYTGDFDWDGQTYRGVYAPLITRELWERVQEILDRRFAKKHRKAKHAFAFSGLISCGHCGCSLVAEIKKVALRLLPLHRVQGKVSGALHTAGGSRGAIRRNPQGAEFRRRGHGVDHRGTV